MTTPALLSLVTKNYIHKLDQITVTGGAISSSFPLSNLLKDSRTYSIRSTSDTLELTIDMQEIKRIDTVILLSDYVDNLTFYEAKMWVSPTPVFTADPILLDIDTDFAMGISRLDSLLGRYVKLSFKSTSIVSLSKIIISEAFTFDTIGFEVGITEEYENFSENTYNKAGIRFSDINSKSMILSGVLHTLDADEKGLISDIFSDLDIYNSFFVIVDPESKFDDDGLYRYSMYCHQQEMASFSNIGGSLWDCELKLREEK